MTSGGQSLGSVSPLNPGFGSCRGGLKQGGLRRAYTPPDRHLGRRTLWRPAVGLQAVSRSSISRGVRPRARSFNDPWSEELDQERPVNNRSGVASMRAPLNWDSQLRLDYLDVQGIAAEVLFPNTVPPFYPSGVLTAPGPRSPREYELRFARSAGPQPVAIRFLQSVPHRRAGFAQVFLDDVDEAIAEVRWAKDGACVESRFPATTFSRWPTSTTRGTYRSGGVRRVDLPDPSPCCGADGIVLRGREGVAAGSLHRDSVLHRTCHISFDLFGCLRATSGTEVRHDRDRLGVRIGPRSGEDGHDGCAP